MSRIGKKPVVIPAGVTITLTPEMVTVKGPKGELSEKQFAGIGVEVKDGHVLVTRGGDTPQERAAHGLIRSLIHNMVVGVTEGFEKKLELVGTGYRVAAKGANLSLSLGFSHPIEVDAAPGITFKVEGNNKITITGSNKYAVGQIAAKIRDLRPPEPYKGKGIRYEGEIVRRKAGKAAKTAAK